MRILGLASIAICLLLVRALQAGDDAALKKEKAALQGVWKVTTFEISGEKADDLDATFEFDKDGKSLTYNIKGDEPKKVTYTLNPAGNPKEIDLMGVQKDKTTEGVYVLEKNTLKICLSADRNDGRPAEVTLKEGKKYVLWTMERAK